MLSSSLAKSPSYRRILEIIFTGLSHHISRLGSGTWPLHSECLHRCRQCASGRSRRKGYGLPLNNNILRCPANSMLSFQSFAFAVSIFFVCCTDHIIRLVLSIAIRVDKFLPLYGSSPSMTTLRGGNEAASPLCRRRMIQFNEFDTSSVCHELYMHSILHERGHIDQSIS